MDAALGLVDELDSLGDDRKAPLHALWNAADSGSRKKRLDEVQPCASTNAVSSVRFPSAAEPRECQRRLPLTRSCPRSCATSTATRTR